VSRPFFSPCPLIFDQ